jgi:prepilin-type N-terminal cleavage/methylation domain-containing protein
MRLALHTGFTLVELVVAAFIFAVGVLALEAMAASSLRRMHRSAQITLAASVARSRLESLGASWCADLEDGTDTVRSVVSSWMIQETTHPGVRAVSQRITYKLEGEERTDRFTAAIRCSE